MAPVGSGVKRKDRVTEICLDCKRRIQENALEVAQLVPYIDGKIQESLNNRLPPGITAWSLDETLNVPYCNGEDSNGNEEDDDLPTDCSICAPYLRHCAAAYAGFSDTEAYVAHLVYEREEAAKKRKVPVIVVDEECMEDGNSVESDKREGRRPEVSHSVIPDQSLIDHMKLVSQLQSVRGRKVINQLLHTDPTAIGCLQGAMAALEQRERSAKTSFDQAKARVLELQEAFQKETQELHQLRRVLESVDDARPRKIPNSSALDGGAKSISTLSTPPSEPTFLQILDANPPVAIQTQSQLLRFRKMLISAKTPTYHEPPEAYAKWMQLHENQMIKGVPIHGPDWVVDLRDVRGRNAVMSRVPAGPSGTWEQRHYHGDCLFAVLRVLAIPGAYASILQRTGTAVAEELDLSCRFAPWGPQFSSLAEVDVAQLLASQGLTVQAADDAWQFCHKYLEVYVTSNGSIFDLNAAKGLLQHVNQTVRVVGRPAGICPPDIDRLPRLGLPLKTCKS